MVSKCLVRSVKASPLKLMLMIKNIRGKRLVQALNWLHGNPGIRAVILYKALMSAFANAQCKDSKITIDDLKVSVAKVDRGKVFKYSKPGAMGRPVILRKRLSNIEINLDNI